MVAPESGRTVSPQEFAVRHFRTAPSSTDLQRQLDSIESAKVEVFSTASGSRVASESGTKVKTAPFRDSRPFAPTDGPQPGDRNAKKQKVLHAYDRSLTIEQVRELLNKNK